ncbi:hypothetical protein MASR2M117_00360 [Paludibacter sp.]
MIVLASSVGNHSNKLFQAIHFEAFAKENNLRFINLTFGCDYLLGSPSTFTMWASYIGENSKYYHTTNRNDIPNNLSCFKVCNG